MAARDTIVERAKWGINNAGQIGYLQSRPMTTLDNWKNKHLPFSCDCSESTTGLYYAAGVPDPNGFGYNGSGNTATLLSNGKRITMTSALPGDVVVFVRPSGETVHAAVMIEKTADPLLFSHGSSNGPLAIRFSTEAAYHKGHNGAVPAWVTFPLSTAVRYHWEIRDGAGRLIATTGRPRFYVATHLRLFLGPKGGPIRWQVKFYRKPIP